MKTSIIALALAIAIAAGATETLAGWGRTRVYVPQVAPVVVTNRVVVPATTYYAPPTTYYAPAPVIAPTVVVRPVMVAPVVVAPSGYVIPPPAFRLRRNAPSLYVP